MAVRHAHTHQTRSPHAASAAADPAARLMFFFERSPWYAAQGVGAYPVLRLSAAGLKAVDAGTGD